MPASLTRHDLAEAKSRYAIALIPADAKAFGVAMDRLLEFARTFGIPSENVTKAVGFYRQAMTNVPADLVMLSVERVCAGWKWGNRMPLPADLLAKIGDDLTRRRNEAVKVSAALRSWQEPMQPVERKPELAEKFKQLIAGFGRGGDA